MFEKVLNLFRVEDVRKKIVTTILLLLVYRLGFQVPVPGVSQERIFQVVEQLKQQAEKQEKEHAEKDRKKDAAASDDLF